MAWLHAPFLKVIMAILGYDHEHLDLRPGEAFHLASDFTSIGRRQPQIRPATVLHSDHVDRVLLDRIAKEPRCKTVKSPDNSIKMICLLREIRSNTTRTLPKSSNQDSQGTQNMKALPIRFLVLIFVCLFSGRDRFHIAISMMDILAGGDADAAKVDA